MGTKQTLIVPGRFEEVRRVCQFMAEGAAECGLSQPDIFHIELACDEACSNIIEHAYDGEDMGEIRADWQFDGEAFIITLHDNGRSFDPDSVPKPSLPSNHSLEKEPPQPPNIDDVKVGGLGLHFMRKMMDSVQFIFDADGNTLIMVKKKR
ncbi:Serine-protein kinase RsbW [hydrothermal vent metagenome]|uniref:Serine-protein kinase RsbW n=1 Tax=hydrothermal vent metagenome TaxID=652676 RepID=A0A3B0W448_9ZZZZ